MAPPRNTRRRRALADAVIEILGTAGIHKLSHRAADERAGLPAGTAANYFPRRDDLLAAAAERVAELHIAEMAAADRAAADRAAAGGNVVGGSVAGGSVAGGSVAGRAASAPAGTAPGPEMLAALIGASLHDAATRNRTRYLAAYELALESTRQPGLADAMSRLGAAAVGTTLTEHLILGLATTAEQVQALIALYNGTLLTLVVAPPGSITPEATLALARCLVTGVLRTES
jgi:AcrR family transcriptional regulator